MSKLVKVEKATNIAVIVVFIVFSILFLVKVYDTYRSHPRIGERLPEFASYRWSTSESLVLVLQKGCHFCEESMPFYRTLYRMEKAGQLSANMVALFPNTHEESIEILRDQSLPIPVISPVPVTSVGVAGTPTLILVDRERTVKGVWIGELDSGGRAKIIERLRK